MSTKGRTAIAAAGIVAVAALALAGCSTTDSAASGSQALTVATDNPNQLKPVVSAFEKANPGVTVTVQDGGTSYQDFIRTGIAAGSAADVIRTFPGSGNNAAIGKLTAAGALADLSGAAWKGDLSTAQKQLFSAKGKLYAVPIGELALGLVYDDQTLKEVGAAIPSTFTDVLALCDTAKKHGKVAYSLWQKGGTVLPSFAAVAPLVYGPNPGFTEDQLAGKASFADSKWVDAFQLQLKMRDAGCFNDGPNGTDFNASAAQVGKGQAIATFAFSDTSSLEAVAPAGSTFTLAPFPVGDDPQQQYLAVADSAGFAVNAKAKNPELARKFVDFLAQPQAQNLYAAAGKGAPAIPNDSFKADSKNQQTIIEYQKAKRTGTWPDQGWPGTGTGAALTEASQTLIAGSDTPQSAAQKMDAAFAKDVAAQK